MKIEKVLRQAFGVNEYGLIDFPKKISSIQISRLLHGDKMGCSYCFPHGFETVNSRQEKYQRNWKRYRKVHYKNIKQVP
ncbi:phosphate ABC transporter substrate-binding protein [Chryseobacterium sp. DT-3]|uniref:phosphate ABC transporter substrate-binding protein n=1 Tax=Chryseobacterium sp. DT-3 TaxID=3396164 RepID=UPI003F1BE511